MLVCDANDRRSLAPNIWERCVSTPREQITVPYKQVVVSESAPEPAVSVWGTETETAME